MKAIRQHAFGGPEQLRLEEVADPEPGPDHVRIAVEAAGVHLVDTLVRQGAGSGAFPPPVLPMTPGREVAGTVDAVGPGTDPAWRGRRVVVHLGQANGGYASSAVAAVGDLLVLPDDVDPAGAVAMVGTGRTTMAILELADIGADDVVVITGAAGGIGTLLVQAARSVGATVVGVAGGRDKAATVAGLGADVAVDHRTDEAWFERVRDALGVRPVTLALDGVGGDMGRAAFDLVGPEGRMVLYGYASGAPMPLSAADLFASGVTVSAAIGARLLQRPGGLRPLAAAALDELAAGRLAPVVHPPFALAAAADAHRAIEARSTIGKVVLVP